MNKITVRVKPNAHKNEVEQIEARSFIVSVTTPPTDGKANEKVIEVLAEYFGKPKRNFSIIRGAASKIKIIEIFC
ncbi:MAG: DUF167 domain-containing protein [Bacteroidota bacterium]|nr:DUF167 domain-containing protein [Bacteroidota bacterium]